MICIIYCLGQVAVVILPCLIPSRASCPPYQFSWQNLENISVVARLISDDDPSIMYNIYCLGQVAVVILAPLDPLIMTCPILLPTQFSWQKMADVPGVSPALDAETAAHSVNEERHLESVFGKVLISIYIYI